MVGELASAPSALVIRRSGEVCSGIRRKLIGSSSWTWRTSGVIGETPQR
jgi:hypothetical protein